MNKKYLLLVIFVLLISPISLKGLAAFISAEDVLQVISVDTEWSGSKLLDGHYLVEEGVTLTVMKGSHLTFRNSTSIEIYGKMEVRGTVLSPVILQKENPGNEAESYSISTDGSGELNINNAEISGGGNAYEAFPIGMERNFINKAYAEIFYTGALNAFGASKLIVQGTKFHDNQVAVNVALGNVSDGRVSVTRSSFEDNDLDVVNQNSQIHPDFKYNWWDDINGPNESKFVGVLDTEFFRTEARLRDPVVIIPGILGSQKKDDVWVMDPIFHTYDNLYDSLVAQGYIPNVDLFLFPYDWYRSNVNTAMLLREKIHQITLERNWPKVDVVAHSMGGLVARQYVENDQYLDNIDQLVTLGTPHDGAPEAYLMWEGGEYYDDISWKREVVNIIIKYLAFKRDETKHQYIHNVPVFSIQELLPIYPYLQDKDSGNLKNYPNEHPWNDFLDGLNNSNKLSKLLQVEFSNIVGRTNLDDTIVKIQVENSLGENNVLWGYGKPDGYDDVIGDRGLERGVGDGTVPLSSATNIPSDLELEANSGHSDLPTKAADKVFTILNGFDPLAHIDPLDIQSMMLVQVFSPVDIQIISPSGKKMGKNFMTGGEYSQISGAFYTGYNTENEFITIPNPEDGEYRILTQGTGEGEYRIEAVKITEGVNPRDEAKESVATFTGTATTGVLEEEKIEIIGDEVQVVEDNDILPPIITIASPESKSYLNNQVLPITYSVTDDISAEASIQKVITLDGGTFSEASIDLSSQPLGNHTLSIQAVDEAGNEATAGVNFKNTVTFVSLYANIDHYKALGLIKKAEDVKFIKTSLKYLEVLQDLIIGIQKSSLPKKVRSLLITGLQRDLFLKKLLLSQYLEKGTEATMIDILVKERIAQSVQALVP